MTPKSKQLARHLVMLALAASAASGHAATATVSPALAACSKALVETLVKGEDELPTYTVKSPSSFVSNPTDPNSFTMLAHSKKSHKLLAKASCKAKPTGEIVSFRALPVKG